MKKLNNKGFTLIEVLAVVVILSIIMIIAIPSIKSSIERSNSKKDKALEKVIKSEAELYLSYYKSSITLDGGKCFISIGDLSGEGYVDEEDLEGYDKACLVYESGELTVHKDGWDSATNKCVSIGQKCHE